MFWFLLNLDEEPLFKEDHLTGVLYPIIDVMGDPQLENIEESVTSIIVDADENFLAHSGGRTNYTITPAARILA